MASSSPLLEESEQLNPKKSTVNRWTNLFYSTILGKDELTISIEKVGSSAPNKVKDKHLQYLIQRVNENPVIFDDILLKFSATINWSSSTISSCKIMMAIHEIIRYNRLYINRFDYSIIFLSEMASHWKIQENYFLERYAASIMNLSQLLTEYHLLCNIIFENGFYYSAKLRLSNYSTDELISFISRLLSYQNILILATIRQSGRIKDIERITYNDALWVIIEESKKILPIIEYLINHAEERLNDGFLLDGGSSLASLREQREVQERTIQDLEGKLNS